VHLINQSGARRAKLRGCARLPSAVGFLQYSQYVLPLRVGRRGVMAAERLINRSAGIYADLLCGTAGSLFVCIDFTKSAAEAPSTDSP
jgi:hypothetical protein